MLQRLFGALLVCVAGGLASVAEAGVAGNSFSGLITLANQETGVSTASFGAENWVFSRQFLEDAQPVFEQGRFTEMDLFVISIWEGSLVSASGSRPVAGISFLSLFTTMTFPGPGDDPIATGVFISDDLLLPGARPQRALGGFETDAAPFADGGCLAARRDAIVRRRAL